MPRPSPIPIRLSPDLLAQIDAVVANRSGFIRDAIKEKLARREPAPTSFDKRVKQLRAQGMTSPVARQIATTEGLQP